MKEEGRSISMAALVEWLKGIEDKACRLYEDASEAFRDDEEFSLLLSQLADDERLHFDLMVLAGENAEVFEGHAPAVDFDQETRSAIEAPFAELESLLKEGIDKKELLKYITLLEFSELNGIFLYAVGLLRDRSPKEYMKAALNIEQHKDRIGTFINTRPEFCEFKSFVDQFPRMLPKERLLVMDDNELNLCLLNAIFSKDFMVISARNGEEGLRKLEMCDFSAVLTDVHMPVMDGLEFYNAVMERRPELKGRFVFFTASRDVRHISFFKRHNLRYLIKPSPINTIRQVILDALAG